MTPRQHLFSKRWVILPRVLDVTKIADDLAKRAFRPGASNERNGIPIRISSTRQAAPWCVGAATLANHAAIRDVADVDGTLQLGNRCRLVWSHGDLLGHSGSQHWHTDRLDASKRGLLAIWALDDFTIETGATEILPLGVESAPVAAVMPAGSVLLLDDRIKHRSRPNDTGTRRLGFAANYTYTGAADPFASAGRPSGGA